MIIQGEREKKDHIYYEFDKTRAPIGVGGMGVVHKGVMVHEITGMTRDVAIKEIQTDTDGAQRQALIEQAEREASIRLMNDNLVEMIDFVQIEETRFNALKKKYYVVSELLHGVSMNDLLAGDYIDFEGNIVMYAQEIGKRYALDREDTSCLIIRNILSGIMALHDKGFLHRDLDPSNVMFTDDGKIKIIDFGIAKKHNRLSPEDGLQQEGAFIGKVDYAAPELIKGNVSAQDFSTDIYSIGIIFYRLITGRLPFEGNRFEIIKGHLNKRPDLSSIKSSKYKAIIAKALQKNPKKRYQSASEMRVALDGPDPLPKWAIGLIGGAVALTLVAGTIVLWPNDKKAPVTKGVYHNSTEFEYKREGSVVHDDSNTVEKKIDTLRVGEILSRDNPQNMLAEHDKNPAVLYAVALKAEKSGLDTTMNAFWNGVLLPQGEVDKYLVYKKDISSLRFAYVTAARALANLDNETYAPGAKEKLRTQIVSLLERIKARKPDNYRSP